MEHKLLDRSYVPRITSDHKIKLTNTLSHAVIMLYKLTTGHVIKSLASVEGNEI